MIPARGPQTKVHLYLVSVSLHWLIATFSAPKMAARCAGNFLVNQCNETETRKWRRADEPMQRNWNEKMAARSAGNFLVKSLGRAPLGETNATKLKRENGGAQRRKIFGEIPWAGTLGRSRCNETETQCNETET